MAIAMGNEEAAAGSFGALSLNEVSRYSRTVLPYRTKVSGDSTKVRRYRTVVSRYLASGASYRFVRSRFHSAVARYFAFHPVRLKLPPDFTREKVHNFRLVPFAAAAASCMWLEEPIQDAVGSGLERRLI